MQQLGLQPLLCFVLCFIFVALAQDYQLSFYPDTSNLAMGDSITISWAGPCSIEYATGCYDWLSVYPSAGCVNGEGANTCYMTNEWVWVDNIPEESKKEEERTYQSGNWTYRFIAPGQYQFRIVRCSCGNCEPITDDMLTCSLYPTITVSNDITVKSIFNGLDALTESQQIVVGFLWWILANNNVPNADNLIQNLIDSTLNATLLKRGGSCVSDVVDLTESFETAAQAFYQLYNYFSMNGLFNCFGDVINVLKGLYPVLNDCNVNSWVGNDFVDGVETLIGELVPGLEEVEEIVRITIAGRDIYIETVNFFSSIQTDEYFAAGVYFGRFVETVIPLVSAAPK